MEQMTFCRSCTKPLSPEESAKTGGKYCEFCSDDTGALKPREAVRAGIAEWLQSWAPPSQGVDFDARADHFMQSMPAWAD